VPSTKAALLARFGEIAPARIALEATTHSPWMGRVLSSLGHEVIVAHPLAASRLADPLRKTDPRDAELLARAARLDPSLLHAVRHRTEQEQADRAVLIARDQLVRIRARLVHFSRGIVKASGARIEGLSPRIFGAQALPQVPEGLQPALVPLLEQLQQLTVHINTFDRQLERIAQQRYPHTALLTQVRGVGTLTALAFVLTIQDPQRFGRRRVAAYLGLVPRRRQSGVVDPRLSITKAGDGLVRRLLVQCAHYILGPFGQDCDLRRVGLRLLAQGGRRSRQRAAIAVARRLAVLLAVLWKTQAVYRPLHQTPAAADAAR